MSSGILNPENHLLKFVFTLRVFRSTVSPLVESRVMYSGIPIIAPELEQRYPLQTGSSNSLKNKIKDNRKPRTKVN